MAQAQKIYSLENIRKINSEFIRPHTNRIRSEISSGLNKNIGILSLSSKCDIAPMWASYANSSKGFVIGFDTANQFFNQRRSESDEFYHLRKVTYKTMQLFGSVSEMTNDMLIQKNESWAYEEEWRMLLPLSTANTKIPNPQEDIFLFDFPASAISQIIFGLHTEKSTIAEIREAISQINPNSHIQFSRAIRGATGFEIVEI
ncbi:DUF2971 domain-containing protein [Pseudomonas sp. P8_241]|uniref:DUF2971 domain-containing protein n=1 Tax=Pseudomonas sp. P8_241 TaxID=3043445 RepID=UPI002A36F46F|nr:DUF2971 domain-containing protein [Pseudomonas sp. P8_241]WPN45108.1 DUF2971 domain-containing protein [Pseudomonas sp. P8_241]